MELSKLKSSEPEFTAELVQAISRGVSKDGISEGYTLGIVMCLLEQRLIFLKEEGTKKTPDGRTYVWNGRKYVDVTPYL